MDLILWRHAEAMEALPDGDDMARTLTGRGDKQAARMAAWLDRQLPQSTDGSVAGLLELVQWPHAKGCTLVVGHQPVLGQTIANLLGLQASECTVKKGAVWWLRYRHRAEGDSTVVVTVQTPELL